MVFWGPTGELMLNQVRPRSMRLLDYPEGPDTKELGLTDHVHILWLVGPKVLNNEISRPSGLDINRLDVLACPLCGR